MAEKIAQTMVTLAEDNRDVKLALRLLLKYEIQALLERLSALGDDSLLILANSSEGTCTHLGTQNADNFLNYVQSNVHLNLKDAFKKFCSNSAGMGGQMGTSHFEPHAATGDGSIQSQTGTQVTAQLPSLLQNQSRNQTVPQFQMCNIPGQLNALNALITGPQQPTGGQLTTRFTPYINTQTGSSQKISTGNFSMDKSKETKNTLPTTVMERKKRNACRHFINKGYCWQGNTCSFLHTRDPQILETFGISLTTTEESNQAPSSSVESSGQTGSGQEEEGAV